MGPRTSGDGLVPWSDQPASLENFLGRDEYVVIGKVEFGYLSKPGRAVNQKAAELGVGEPDVGNAPGAVLIELLDDFAEAVVGGEDLDRDVRGSGWKPLRRQIPGKDRYIGYAVTGLTELVPDLRRGVQRVPLF